MGRIGIENKGKKILLELEDIQSNGIRLKLGRYQIEITFYTSAWVWTHGLKVAKNLKEVTLYCSEKSTKETIRILTKRDKDADTLWTVLRLLRRLSWNTKSERFSEYLVTKDLDRLLKGVWLSMVLSKYDKALRKKVRRLVRSLVKRGEISQDNKWVKKILKIEEYIVWKRILTTEWEEV